MLIVAYDITCSMRIGTSVSTDLMLQQCQLWLSQVVGAILKTYWMKSHSVCQANNIARWTYYLLGIGEIVRYGLVKPVDSIAVVDSVLVLLGLGITIDRIIVGGLLVLDIVAWS